MLCFSKFGGSFVPPTNSDEQSHIAEHVESLDEKLYVTAKSADGKFASYVSKPASLRRNVSAHELVCGGRNVCGGKCQIVPTHRINRFSQFD